MTLLPCSAGGNPRWLETSVQVRQLPFKIPQQHADVHKEQNNQICQSSTSTGRCILDLASGSGMQINAELYNHIHLHKRYLIANEPQEQKP